LFAELLYCTFAQLTPILNWLIAELVEEFGVKGKGKQASTVTSTTHATTTGSNCIYPEISTS
jgi:hypothetical protein